MLATYKVGEIMRLMRVARAFFLVTFITAISFGCASTYEPLPANSAVAVILQGTGYQRVNADTFSGLLCDWYDNIIPCGDYFLTEFARLLNTYENVEDLSLVSFDFRCVTTFGILTGVSCPTRYEVQFAQSGVEKSASIEAPIEFDKTWSIRNANARPLVYQQIQEALDEAVTAFERQELSLAQS